MSTVVQLSKFKSVTSKDNNPHTPYNRSNFNIRKEKDQLWSDAVVKVWNQTDNLLMSALNDLPYEICADSMCQIAVQIQSAFHELIELLEKYEACVETDTKYVRCWTE
jgi:hypothetical protein